MLDNRIGAQFFTIRNFCKTIEDFDESCKKVSEIGYKVVQLSGISNFTGEEVKAILDKYDLVCACTHRAPQNYLEHLDEEIKFHKAIGCNVCGLGAMEYKYLLTGWFTYNLNNGNFTPIEYFSSYCDDGSLLQAWSGDTAFVLDEELSRNFW